MSVPINPLVVVSAARVALNVAKDLLPDVAFSDVLAATGTSAADHDDSQSPMTKLKDLLRSGLENRGVALDPPINLEIQSDGRIIADPFDSRSNAISDLVASSKELQKLAQQVAAPGGTTTLTLGTSRLALGTSRLAP